MILIIKNKKQRNISLIPPSHQSKRYDPCQKYSIRIYIYIKIYEKKEIIRAAKEQG